MTPDQTAWHLKQTTTTSIVLAEADDPNVFAVIAKFPSGRCVSMQAAPIADDQCIDPRAYKRYVDAIVSNLLSTNDDRSLSHTNWPSFMAAMQRCIIDFNQRREKRMGESSTCIEVQ